MTPESPVDSPTPWVARHIEDYVSTAGAKGHEWRGVPTLLLTTRGRKSGLLRRSALIYGTDGDDYVIVASKGGHSHHPLWFTNLRAHPAVRVQVGPDEFDAVAHVAEGPERARLWELMVEIWPDYENYKKKTDREIPVVVLRPRSAPRN